MITFGSGSLSGPDNVSRNQDQGVYADLNTEINSHDSYQKP